MASDPIDRSFGKVDQTELKTMAALEKEIQERKNAEEIARRDEQRLAVVNKRAEEQEKKLRLLAYWLFSTTVIVFVSAEYYGTGRLFVRGSAEPVLTLPRL